MSNQPSVPRKLKKANHAWIRAFSSDAGARYVQIAEQIMSAVRDGVLKPGDRLPPQRELAQLMGVDLTTVTRAYTEVRHAGLLDAQGAGGSYIATRLADRDQTVDLGMNIPPLLNSPAFARLLERGLAHVQESLGIDSLMSYHIGAGARVDREAGAAWLEPALGKVSADQVIVCAGAQAALSALLLAYTDVGDAIAIEHLTYPGMLTSCRVLQRDVLSIASDHEGMDPDALDRQCRTRAPRLIYLIPTMQNPTATTMSLARREAIRAVARKHGIGIIEDDPYWLLAGDAPPPLAAMGEPTADTPVFYVSTLSKCWAPGLRIAYMVIPRTHPMEPVLDALRATTLMASPSMAALATYWIRNGQGEDMLQRVRRELAQRQRIAARVLPAGAQTHAHGLHLWLPLPPGLDQYRLIQTASEQGLGVAGSDAFSAHDPVASAIRISLGGAADQASLEVALRRLAEIIQAGPERRRTATVV